MKDRGRNAFTPTDLCGLIAHETAALLYGVDADGIPSAESLREGLVVFTANLRSELAEVSATLEQRNSQSATMEVSM